MLEQMFEFCRENRELIGNALNWGCALTFYTVVLGATLGMAYNGLKGIALSTYRREKERGEHNNSAEEYLAQN